MINSHKVLDILAPLYSKQDLEALTPEKRAMLARIEGSGMPECTKAALRARVFGRFDEAERIRAAAPQNFTLGGFAPYAHTIPDVSRPTGKPAETLQEALDRMEAEEASLH